MKLWHCVGMVLLTYALLEIGYCTGKVVARLEMKTVSDVRYPYILLGGG